MGTRAFECLYPQQSTAIHGYPRSGAAWLEGRCFRTTEPKLRVSVQSERLDRTQEVGGSNPPSSIASKSLQTRHLAFPRAVRTAPPFSPPISHYKPKALAEAARALRPGFAVSDVIADPDMDEATKADVASWTGCVAGALTEKEFRAALTDAGLDEIEVRPTHRVHAGASAAIIRAVKPT
jgi:hypothetical protein